MNWVLKLPSDAKTTEFRDVDSFKNYQNPEFGNIGDKRRFGLTPRDKGKIISNPPKPGQKVLIRFNWQAYEPFKHIVFAEGVVDRYYDYNQQTPPLVENDTEIIAIIELKNVKMLPIRERWECLKRTGQPPLLTPLDEVI
tara:strand:+ start:249 stop:668 length:420 start_codon:yes stop_codon:yes gene_type:complete